MGSERDLDLARTATAPLSGQPAAGGGGSASTPTLGRYRIERELGAGAMGVVHAAFDPDLERRVALKVLRSETTSIEAKDRLMREARAMARLSHPNVVTVHEVGTAVGRDFVAMELILGETLADWLRAARRPPAAIVEAFLAAGRGLAAAHAAGIVHRDFKPHNVLRSHGGRIVVTDFGLAREADGVLPPAAIAVLLPGSESSNPSALSGLTVTGSLLGTPAYMAPEQWRGGAISPATDQFAYCVALWEALAGERPYRGPTFDDLRAQVARGPAVLDATRIPRRLRGVLRRGLDPEPAKRWPSMDALLTRLVRAQRRTGVAIAIAIGATAAAAALMFARRAEPPVVAACPPPARAIDTVWSPAIRADLAARTSSDHAAMLDVASWAWRAARGSACRAPAAVQRAQLACLDGALARLDAVRQAAATSPDVPAEEIQAQLVDPTICHRASAAEVPRLTMAPTRDAIAALALHGRSRTEHEPSDAELAALAGAHTADPCARVIATLAFASASRDVPRTRALMTDAASVVDQCGDDRLRADFLIQDSPYHWELPIIGPRGEAAIRQAQVAAARVMQPDIAAQLAGQTLHIARQRDRWDEVMSAADARIAGFQDRGLIGQTLRGVALRDFLRLMRSEPEDIAAVIADVRAWRPVAVARRDTERVRALDIVAAAARLRDGDITAHADLVQQWRAQPAREPLPDAQRITGEIVDVRGRPVAGAHVACSINFVGDSAGLGRPALLNDDLRDDTLQMATSDDAGRFVIEHAVPGSAIAAELGDLRSLPAAAVDRVRLVLAPTRSLSGRVALGRIPPTRASVIVLVPADPTSRFSLAAPIAADGTFTLSRVPTNVVQIGVEIREPSGLEENVAFRRLPASPDPLAGIALDLVQSDRALDIVVRSTVTTALPGAQVLVLPGTLAIHSIGDLLRLQGGGLQVRMAMPAGSSHVASPARDGLRSDDLVAHFTHAAPGALTVCAIGLSIDLLDSATMRRIQSHLAQVTLRCDHVTPTTRSLVLAVPPQQRFD